MYTTYIAIEKSVERFEKYKALWEKRGITGMWAATMTEGIKAAINMEKSNAGELFFVSIVANEMPDFIDKLSILSEVTSTPILCATENYTEKEHHEALNNGADFYAHFCETTEENIEGVIAEIKSIKRRKKQKEPLNTLTHGEITMSRTQHRTFVGGVCVDLTCQEFDVLYYFMSNIGSALSYDQIYRNVWDAIFNSSSVEVVKVTIKRLRKKLAVVDGGDKIIENVRGFGYKIPL